MIQQCNEQWNSESTHQWTNESMVQRLNESVNQRITESRKQWANDSKIQWPLESPRIHQWFNEPTNKWITESMNQWISESRNHRINEPRNQWINEFCKPRPPKVLWSCQISGDLNANQNLAIQSRAVRCTFCRPFAQIEAREPRKQRPYFGDPRSHITRKNAWFRARECFYPWVHTLPNCYKQPPEKNDKYIQIPWNWIVVNNAKCNVYCFWSWRYIVGLLENGVCPPNGLFLQGKWW